MIDRERIEADVRLADEFVPATAPYWIARLSNNCEQLLAALAAAEAENARLRGDLDRIAVGELAGDFVKRDGSRSDRYVLSRESLQEIARDALASRPGEEQPCERCHGDGVITVGGTSVNPHTGILGPDPQAADDAVCPDCAGTGVAP